jgi:hypothetical protein
MNPTASYILTLRTQDRLLVVGMVVFFALFIGFAAWSIWEEPPLALLFVLAWAALVLGFIPARV